MQAQFALSSKAALLINGILRDLNRSGYQTKNLVLRVSPESQLATESSISTDLGELEVKVSIYAYKGIAYIIGKEGHKGFAWVWKPKDPEPKPDKPKKPKKQKKGVAT